MKGVSADDIVDILSRYIPVDDITSVVNLDAVEGMNKVTKSKSITGHISGEKSKHSPTKIVSLMMKDFYNLSDNDFYGYT